MPRTDPLQESFTGGEFGPLAQGRVSADRYKTGLARLLNMVPVLEGPITRRPGSYFSAEVYDSSKKSRLHRFEFSTTQAYIIEFANLKIRFFRNGGQIVETAVNITGATQANPCVITAVAHGYSNGDEVYITGVAGMTQLNGRNFIVAGVTANTFELVSKDLVTNINSTAYTAYVSGGTVARVVQVTSPYLEADLFNLQFCQSQDVLYIWHPSYAPRKLTRTSHTAWTLTEVDFLDGPYLPVNTTATTFTSSGASGAVNITASTNTFVTTDVGRLIRIYLNSTWSWLEITGYTSPTVVAATVRGPNIAAAATTQWRLGIWSTTTGFPACAVFHEDRLCPAGATSTPQRFDMSQSGDYENFGPSALDSTGTVSNSNAISFSLNSNDVNTVRWLQSAEKALLAGTVGGEWAIRPSSQSEALNPTNVSAKEVSTWGSANMASVKVGNVILFAQRSTKRVRELSYYFYDDSYRAPDRTKLASHIAGTGFTQFAVQKHPHSLVWAVRNDGVLACMTYEKEDDNLIVGWHRHIMGGYSDAANSDAIVESVAVIPSSDGTRDEVWLVVKRYIGGRTVRYIEYLTPFFDDQTAQPDAFFVDCGLTYDSPVTISGGTRANPCVITATAHGLSNGDEVVITGVLGLVKTDGTSGVNSERFVARNVTANTLELESMSGSAINSTTWSAYVSGGELRKLVTTISPLWHLEGQSIAVLGDGAVQPNVTVTNGTATLSTKAATVQLGFNTLCEGQQLRQDAGSAVGTSVGKLRRVHKAVFDLYRSLGLKVGVSFNTLEEVTFRTTNMPYGAAPSLFTGIHEHDITCSYDFDAQVCWRSTQPLPLTIRGVGPKMKTEDGA